MKKEIPLHDHSPSNSILTFDIKLIFFFGGFAHITGNKWTLTIYTILPSIKKKIEQRYLQSINVAFSYIKSTCVGIFLHDDEGGFACNIKLNFSVHFYSTVSKLYVIHQSFFLSCCFVPSSSTFHFLFNELLQL